MSSQSQRLLAWAEASGRAMQVPQDVFLSAAGCRLIERQPARISRV
jgi:hypothetical protein